MAKALNIFKNRDGDAPFRQEWKLINTKEAERILRGNINNRPFNAANLQKISADMKAGRFLQSPTPIIVDENGFLRDGQHRLTAIIDTNTEHYLWVVTVPNGEEIRDIIDIGQNRTLSDMLFMAGSEDAKFITQALKMIRSEEKPGNKRESEASVHLWAKACHPEIEEYWLRNKSTVTSAYKASGGLISKHELFYHLYTTRGDEYCSLHTVVREIIDYLINEPKGKIAPPSPKFKFMLDALSDLKTSKLGHKYKRDLRMGMVDYLCHFESKQVPAGKFKSIRGRFGFIRNSIGWRGLSGSDYREVWGAKVAK